MKAITASTLSVIFYTLLSFQVKAMLAIEVTVSEERFTLKDHDWAYAGAMGVNNPDLPTSFSHPDIDEIALLFHVKEGQLHFKSYRGRKFKYLVHDPVSNKWSKPTEIKGDTMYALSGDQNFNFYFKNERGFYFRSSSGRGGRVEPS